MDRTATRFDAETTTQTATTKRKTKATRAAEADRSRRMAFESFAAALRGDLAPQGTLETIYADRAIVAAWRLREAVDAERTGVLAGLGVDSADLFGHLADDLRRQADRAGLALVAALDDLLQICDVARSNWGQAAPLDTTVRDSEADAIDETLVAPEYEFTPVEDDAIDDAPADEADDAPLPRWQDRLVYDANVSEESPVVKGTWVTVSQIVTLIVDGFTWADILRTHPELTEDDIRVCLAFATEGEADDARGVYLA